MNIWRKTYVSELGRIVTGKTPKTSVRKNYGGIIPFLTPSDDMESKYVNQTIKTISDIGIKEVRNCLLPPNSVCVSCIGSNLGKVVITKDIAVTNQQINSIVVDQEMFDVDFVYYSMMILGKELNYISKTSTAVPIINKTTFSNCTISCPPLPLQKTIGKVLASLDDKIELNRQINQNLPRRRGGRFALPRAREITAPIGRFAYENRLPSKSCNQVIYATTSHSKLHYDNSLKLAV